MHVSLPESYGGSRVQTWNRYAYVANNPLNNIDPLGLSCEDPHDGQPCNVNVTATPLDPPSWMWLAFEGWPGTGSSQSFFCMLMGGCNFGNGSSGGGGGGGGSSGGVKPQPIPKPKPPGKPSAPIDRNQACPGSSVTFSVDAAFALGVGGNASVTIGVNSVGISVSRGYGATVGTPQAGINWQVGWIDLSHTTGMLDLSLNAGPGKRLAVSIPWGNGLDGHSLPTGIQFGGGFGGNVPRAFGAMYEDQTAGYQNFCVPWGDIVGQD
jgi:hypothetical protein